MFIKDLSLKNFRNYKNISLEFSPEINLITGINATGKTNILESISILANIKSFRNVPDNEIIKWGENSYYCSLVLEDSPFSKFEIGCSYLSNILKKKAKIDNISKKRISDYYGKFLIVIFSPEDITLVTGSPDTRRKFFDAVISKVDTKYLDTLTDFKKITGSRNRILRDIREKKTRNNKELDIWDNMFVQRASLILEKRFEFLDKFNSSFKDSSLYISGKKDSLAIEYKSTLASFKIEDMLEEIQKSRNKDIYKGFTGTGPHRDDYVFLDEAHKIFKNIASQGQKRTASISLKIAEYRFIEQQLKIKPVIIMDDMFGELDEERRNKIMDIIDGNQVIITSVNPELIYNDKSIKIQRYQVLPGGIVNKI